MLNWTPEFCLDVQTKLDEIFPSQEQLIIRLSKAVMRPWDRTKDAALVRRRTLEIDALISEAVKHRSTFD